MKNNDIIIDRRLGNKKRYFLTQPSDYAMWLPDEIKKCVAFLCIENAKGEKEPVGTGFFVTVPSEKYPDRHFTYFVTAKHNIIGIGNRKFWVRVNGKDGKLIYVGGDNNTPWFYHPEHETNPADIAVTNFAIDITSMDIRTIPAKEMIFPTPELIKKGELGIGNEVFITGLFTKLSGRERNLPIVRMGNIAMLPDEKVPGTKFGEMEAYLIEGRSIGGVSGSPVFFCKERMRNGSLNLGGGTPFYLGGLIHGHWDTLEEKIDSFLPTLDVMELKKEGMVNMGIAIVAPVTKLVDILNSDELKKGRTESDKNYEKEHAPTLD